MYEDGDTVTGSRVLETVKIEDFEILNQIIGIADHVHPRFLRNGSDGILGLALIDDSWVSPPGINTPMHNFHPGRSVVELESRRDRVNPDVKGSFCAIGNMDAVPLDSIVQYTDLVDREEGVWRVKSEDIQIERSTYTRKGNKAVIDTGSSLALVDFQTCNKIYGKIPGARSYVSAQAWMDLSARRRTA